MKRIILDTENAQLCCQCKEPVQNDHPKIVIGYGKMKRALAPLAIMHPDCFEIWYDQSEAQAQHRARVALQELGHVAYRHLIGR